MKNPRFLKMTVNDVPLLWQPLFFLYSYITAALLYIAVMLAWLTCEFEISGAENLKSHKKFIFCLWHTYIALYFATFPDGRNQVWLQHPVWMLKPVHLFLRLTGVTGIILGSTGNTGRKSADELVQYLKKGCSTVILPDGASGPPYVMKKGMFHIASQTGIPIIPIYFSVSKYIALPTWDHKTIPLPFSKIRAIFGKPVIVAAHNFKNAGSEVEAFLGKGL